MKTSEAVKKEAEKLFADMIIGTPEELYIRWCEKFDLSFKGADASNIISLAKMATDEARRDFANEIDKFLIKTSAEDDTVRLRKLNDWITKEKELKCKVTGESSSK